MPELIASQVDDNHLRVPVGTSAAAAVIISGHMHFRLSVSGEARGPLCGMGICFECKATIDGRPGGRTCQLPVREGMVIRTSC
jgi:hypothetical protein